MFAADHAATALLVKCRFPSAPLAPLLVSVQAMEFAWVALNYLGVERTTTASRVRSVADIHLSLPMPYSHSVVTAVLAAVMAWLAVEKGLGRPALGRAVGIGIAAHLVLDLLHARARHRAVAGFAISAAWAGALRWRAGGGIRNRTALWRAVLVGLAGKSRAAGGHRGRQPREHFSVLYDDCGPRAISRGPAAVGGHLRPCPDRVTMLSPGWSPVFHQEQCVQSPAAWKAWLSYGPQLTSMMSPRTRSLIDTRNA